MISAGGEAWIGLDLGTSGLKGLAIGGSGQVLGRAAAAYPTSRPAERVAEQDPARWLAAVSSVAAGLASQVPADRWRAIGLSAMMPVLVPAGPGGRATGPAVTWEDSRAESVADEFRQRRGADSLYRQTGQWADGRYIVPMFMRLARDDPGLAAATTMLLSAKDYLFGWLTGEPATDPSTAAGFGCYRLADGRWDGPGLLQASLPPVCPAATIRLLLSDLGRQFGCGPIPVCLGAADSVLGALGLGARLPGQIAYVAGTSTVILGVTDQLVFDAGHRFLVTPLAEPGRWGLEMDLLATGSALEWLAGLLGGGLDARGVAGLAAGTDPLEAPVVLPYLSPGEQGALWDPDLHGAITGLTLGHGARHLARGLISGIVLESRRCLAVLDQSAAFGPDLLVAGGSAASERFRADLADATGRRVIVPDTGDTDFSALGAAMLARQASGGGAASSSEAAAVHVTEPDASRSKAWDQLWERHEAARRSLAGRREPR